MLGFQRKQGDFPLAHQFFHVGPGAVNALGQQVAVLVDDVVHDHQPQVRHAEVVDVGEGQCHLKINVVPILDDLVVLAAGIPCRFGHAGENALQGKFDLFGCFKHVISLVCIYTVSYPRRRVSSFGPDMDSRFCGNDTPFEYLSRGYLGFTTSGQDEDFWEIRDWRLLLVNVIQYG